MLDHFSGVLVNGDLIRRSAGGIEGPQMRLFICILTIFIVQLTVPTQAFAYGSQPECRNERQLPYSHEVPPFSFDETISQAERERFVSRMPCPSALELYGGMIWSFYRTLRQDIPLEGALEEFAVENGMSLERAGQAAEGIYASYLFQGRRGECENCDLSINHQLTSLLREVGYADESGNLFQFFLNHQNRGANRSIMLEMVADHPAYTDILTHAFRYSGVIDYILPLVLSNRASALNGSQLLFHTHNHSHQTDFLAMLDYSNRHEGGLGLPGQAAFIDRLIDLGLESEAFTFYESLSDTDQERVFDTQSPEYLAYIQAYGGTLRFDRQLQSKFLGITVALALECFERGRRREAFDLIEQARRIDEENLYPITAAQFLRELENPSNMADQAEEWLTQPHLPDGTVLSEFPQSGDLVGITRGGWIGLANFSRSYRLALVEYAVDHGLPDIAARLMAPSGLSFNASHLPPDGFDHPELDRLSERYHQRIEPMLVPLHMQLPDILNPVPRPMAYSERRLNPSQIERLRARSAGSNITPVDIDYQALQSFREKFQPSFGYFQIIRMDRYDSERLVLFASNALDPVPRRRGRVYAPRPNHPQQRLGLWIARSTDQGETWGSPIYLGVQIWDRLILSDETIPLRTDSGIQIAMDRIEITNRLDPRELQEWEIVEERSDRQLVLRFEWDDLLRDQDTDGISDLVEHRLGLSMTDPDTDGDGLLDLDDPMPLSPFSVPGVPQDAIDQLALTAYSDIFRVRTGPETTDPAPQLNPLEESFDQFQIVKIAGDPNLFPGMTPPHRTFVYTLRQRQEITRHYSYVGDSGVGAVVHNDDFSIFRWGYNHGVTGGHVTMTRTEDGFDIQTGNVWWR